MLQTIPFTSHAEIEALFTHSDQQTQDYEAVARFIQSRQPDMDKVQEKLTELAEQEKPIILIGQMQFVYDVVYHQINDLCKKIDDAYEQNPTAELKKLLRQCSHLRATIWDICSILRQYQAQTNVSFPNLADTDFQAAIEASVQKYGATA